MLLGALRHPGADRLEHRQVEAATLGRIFNQRRVLGRQRQPERGLEIALDDRLALDPQVGEVERPAVQRLEEQRRIETQPLRQRDRLGAGLGDRSTQLLSTSFSLVLDPASPTQIVFWETASKIG